MTYLFIPVISQGDVEFKHKYVRIFYSDAYIVSVVEMIITDIKRRNPNLMSISRVRFYYIILPSTFIEGPLTKDCKANKR